MFCSQSLVIFVQVRELSLTVLVSNLERCVAGNTSLLRQLLVLLVQSGSLIFTLSKLGLRFHEFLSKIGHLLFVAFVLCLNVLHLLSCVREHDHMVDDFTSQTGQLLISFLNLLVKSLILDLELLVIDQMETFGQLLLLFEDFFLVG